MSQAITKAADGTEVSNGAIQKKSTNTIQGLLEAKMGAIKAVATKHLTAEKIVKLALVACSRSPLLLECHPMSMLQAVMNAAELGLTPGPLGQCYFIPFRNNKNNTIECQFIIGYRGLIELARRSGNIVSIQAEVVRSGDEFEFEYGIEPKFRHVPKASELKAENITHAWAIAHFVGGGHQVVVMRRPEIDRIKNMSKAGNFGPWKDHYAEMAKKTAVRRLCKMLPLTPEAAADMGIAESHDSDTFEFKMPEGIAPEVDADNLLASDALADEIGGEPKGTGEQLQAALDAEAKGKGEQGSLIPEGGNPVGTVDRKRK